MIQLCTCNCHILLPPVPIILLPPGQVMESFSTLHLVMECAGEGDVQARIIKEGPLNEDQARHIFAQVTAAINHMVSPLLPLTDAGLSPEYQSK